MGKGRTRANSGSTVTRRKGVYRRCRGFGGCGGRGYLRGKGGEQLHHSRCGGDGWIRVGTATSARGRPPRGRRSYGPPRRRGSWRQRQRKAWKRTKRNAAVSGGLALAGYAFAGTVGLVVVGVVLALVLVLAVGTRARAMGGGR